MRLWTNEHRWHLMYDKGSRATRHWCWCQLKLVNVSVTSIIARDQLVTRMISRHVIAGIYSYYSTVSNIHILPLHTVDLFYFHYKFASTGSPKKDSDSVQKFECSNEFDRTHICSSIIKSKQRSQMLTKQIVNTVWCDYLWLPWNPFPPTPWWLSP